MGFDQTKIQMVAGKISNNKYLKSIMNGLSMTLPAIMLGAMSTLLAGLPFAGYQKFIQSTGLKTYLALPASLTTDLLALFAAFFVAYCLVEAFEKDGAMAGLISLISFLVVTPLGQMKVADQLVNIIPFDWLGSKGLFVALIVGMITGRIYVWILDKNLVIKLPDGVPPTIGKSFVGLVPGFAIVLFFLAVRALFAATAFGSMHQCIYTMLQIPLEGLGGTLGALILTMVVAHLLWVFGIHGMIIVISIMMPIWMALDMANLKAYSAGQPLPNIIGLAFVMCYVLIGGSGATYGLNLLMLRAKSKRYKVLGGLALPAGFFGINEPIIFGTPVILNPLLLVPFIGAPVVCIIVSYLATVMNLVPRLMGTYLPLGTPLLVSGFLEGSWKIAVLEVLLVVISVLIYYPFFKILDHKAYLEETSENQGE